MGSIMGITYEIYFALNFNDPDVYIVNLDSYVIIAKSQFDPKQFAHSIVTLKFQCFLDHSVH